MAFAGGRYALKLFRRIEPGAEPGTTRSAARCARTRFTARAGAGRRARVSPPGLEPGTLAVVQSVVNHQGSGWHYTIDEPSSLLRAGRRTHARWSRPGLPICRIGAKLAGRRRFSPPWSIGILNTAAMLGRRTAELHANARAFARSGFRAGPPRRAETRRAGRRNARAR